MRKSYGESWMHLKNDNDWLADCVPWLSLTGMDFGYGQPGPLYFFTYSNNLLVKKGVRREEKESQTMYCIENYAIAHQGSG